MSENKVSTPISIPKNNKPHFAKPKLRLKPKPKPVISINVKSPSKSLDEKRREIIEFIEAKFDPCSLGRMCDYAIRSYGIPIEASDEEALDEEKWGEEILSFNRKHIMETLSDRDIEYLYDTKRWLEDSDKSICFMDEEEMRTSIPANYFIFNLKGKMILACYR